MTTHRSARLVALALWMALCVGGGALIGLATQGGDSSWYASLNRPSWTPRAWVFAPVWTVPIFFPLQQITWALVDIVALWLLIVMTIRLFARVNRAAAWLLAPYLAWVSFATALNGAIAWMN
ncbi:MAG TPA: TspO/MBR family protein [Gemmatimonadaceae bacterium]